MERDFMGLTVKQEIHEEPTDPAVAVQSSTMSNKMSAPLHYQSSLASTGPVIIRSAENVDYSLQPYSGVPQNPVSVVPAASSTVVGTTELRNDSHASNGPAQLTIFYAGSVSVYSNVSPEKAQAIMLLAGNGTPNTSGPTLAASPALLPRPSIIDGFAVNPACFPSPIYTIPFTVPSVVPLARKASLARFLEKRKERVIRASPCATMSPKCDSPGSASISYPGNSSSTCPLPPAN